MLNKTIEALQSRLEATNKRLEQTDARLEKAENALQVEKEERKALQSQLNEEREKRVALQMDHDNLRVRASVGAWIEYARKRILSAYGVEFRDGDVGKTFSDTLKAVKSRSDEESQHFWRVVYDLFELTPNDWKVLSEFYYLKRCGNFAHSRLPAEKTLPLLEALPNNYKNKSHIFARFIRLADAMEQAGLQAELQQEYE